MIFIGFTTAGFSFMSIGDWGASYYGGHYLRNALAVSETMNYWNTENNGQFVLNPGDNFYFCGIDYTTEPQIIKDFMKPFSNINITWISLLGNHDCGIHPDEQLELHQIIPNWIMDERYYRRNYKSKLL